MKKKILFLEARENLFGHIRQNEAIIKALSQFLDVTVIFPKDWFSDLPDNVKYEKHTVTRYNIESHLAQILMAIDYLKHANKLDKEEKYDYILFAAYNIYALKIATKIIKESGTRLFVIHHSIIDQISESKLKKMVFDSIKNKLNHISIEKFLSDKLEDGYGIEKSRLYWFPHQLNTIQLKYDIIYDFVGISNSNDEKWVESILKSEKESQIFRNNAIHIVIRSAAYDFSDGYLTIIKGKLSDEEYYRYILQAKVILVPFGDEFNYRMSGTVIDALSNRKKIMGRDIPVIREYSKCYPGTCKIGVKADDLVRNKKNGFVDSEIEQTILEKFYNDHSKQTFECSFRKMFDN